jgi:hypothetical protein
VSTALINYKEQAILPCQEEEEETTEAAQEAEEEEIKILEEKLK